MINVIINIIINTYFNIKKLINILLNYIYILINKITILNNHTYIKYIKYNLIMYFLENKDGIIKINKNINLIGRHPNCNIILNVFICIYMNL
jgi:hypothetical protein